MIHNIYLKSGFCEISKNIFFTEQLWATATECGRNGKILNDDFLPNRVYFFWKRVPSSVYSSNKGMSNEVMQNINETGKSIVTALCLD